MITLTIEDKKVENIFLNEFNSNKESFFDFIKMSFDNIKPKNSENLAYLEDEIKKGYDSGRSKKTHSEVFAQLREKYGIN